MVVVLLVNSKSSCVVLNYRWYCNRTAVNDCIRCNVQRENDMEIQRGNSVLAFKAGFWYTASTFLARAVAIITTPIFARLLSVSDYGEFSNFANWAAILLLITSAELHTTLSRAYYDFKDVYDDYISSVTILGIGITTVLYLVFLLGDQYISKIVSIPKQYVHLLFLFLLVTACRMIFYARERTLYRYKTVAFITFISFFIPTLISVFLVYLFPTEKPLSVRLYGFYLSASIIGVYCAISLFVKSRVFRLRYCRYALALSIPLLVHYMAATLLKSTNIIVTKSILGAGAAAIISIAGSTTHVFTILSQALTGALTTWLMDNLELGKKVTVKKGTFYYALLLAVVVLSAILIAPEIVYILGGDKYVASVTLIPGLIFASYLQAVTSVLIIILTYDKNIIKTSIFTGIFALLSIAAKVLLLPRHGLIMLVYVNIAVFFMMLLINYILVQRAGYADIVYFKGIIGIIIALGIIVLLSPQIYSLTSFRLFLMGILVSICLILAYFNKRNIIGLLKK